MDALLDKYIEKCFPEHEFIRKLVRKELDDQKNCPDPTKVGRLAFLAIKSRMKEVMRTTEMDIYSEVAHDLLTGEVDSYIKDLCKEGPAYQLAIESEKEHERINLYRKVRVNGPFMLMLCQEIPRFENVSTKIILNQKNVQIWVDGLNVAEIAHRNGLDFDTFWAEKFSKCFMSKMVNSVSFQMTGEGLPADRINLEYMGNYMNSLIIDKLPRGIPKEGWENYINQEHPVYIRSDPSVVANNYSDNFYGRNEYRPNFEQHYWGYIEEEKEEE